MDTLGHLAIYSSSIMFLRANKRHKDGKEHRYWSVVENRRVAGGRSVQKTLLYLGEISDSERAAWTRAIEAVDEREQTRSLKRLRALATGRKNVHLLHIRKSGGTALKHVLNQHDMTEGFAIHTYPHRTGLMDLPRNHAVMFVIRDPLKRFVSGFQSRLRKGATANHVPWSPGEEQAFTTFPDPESLALALDPNHELHQQALAAMKSIGHQRSSLGDWLGTVDLLKQRESDILYIGRTESLDDQFPALAAMLGLPADAGLPRDPELAHRSTPGANGTRRPLRSRRHQRPSVVRHRLRPDRLLRTMARTPRRRGDQPLNKRRHSETLGRSGGTNARRSS